MTFVPTLFTLTKCRVLGIAASLLVAATASPVHAAAPNALLSGRALTASDRPNAGSRVVLLAMPSPSAEAGLSAGQSLSDVIVGQTVTNSLGRFSIPRTSQTLPSGYRSADGYVNYEVVATGPAGLSVTHFSSTAELSGTLLSGELTGLRTVSTSPQPTVAATHCWDKYYKGLGSQTTEVARAFSSSNDAAVTVSYTAHADSNLGVGISGTADGKFSADGTAEDSNGSDSTTDFGTVRHKFKAAFNTTFKYAKYWHSCVSSGGQDSWYEVDPGEFTGGATLGAPSSTPKVKKKYCYTYRKGASQTIAKTSASTFGGGVHISKWIGIDLSAQTGYSKHIKVQAKAAYGELKICGKSGPPTDPGVFILVPR